MNKIILSLFIIASVAASGFATAAANTSKAKSAKSKSLNVAKASASDKSKLPGTRLNTDHYFDDLAVRGKYQSPSEGLVTVENEKNVEDILDYRTHFKDRLQKSLEEK